MPPRPRNEQERREMRDRILNAARNLFVERGVEATTMREIANRVGCSATAIYLYFRDKNDLLRALCASDFMSLAAGIKLIDAVPDPMRRLRLLGEGYARFALGHPNHYRMMFMTPRPELDKHELGIEPGNPEQDAYAMLQRLVGEAHAAGCFRTDLQDTELISETLWAAVHGICALEITLGQDGWVDWRPFERRLGLMLDALFIGLARAPNG